MKNSTKLIILLSSTLLTLACNSTSIKSSNNSSNSNNYSEDNNSNTASNSNNSNYNSRANTLYPKSIKKTNQTISYNLNGNEVIDNSIKDDAYYKKGVTPNYQRVNQVVIDNVQDLEWADNSDVATKELSYSQAKNYCSSLNLENNSDWRVPTIKELSTIVDFTKRAPSIDSTFKYTKSGGDDIGYWSSSYSGVWRIWTNFFSGKEHWYETQSNKHYIRCVRGGLDGWAKANFKRENGVVKDINSALEWQDSYSGSTAEKSWQEAIGYCENLTLNSKNDWRLPNINELYSILSYDNSNSRVDAIFEKELSSNYWSSTSHSASANRAWYIDFKHGIKNYTLKNRNLYIRCVRGN